MMNKIKWTFTSFFAGLLACTGFAQSGEFTLQGEITGQSGPFLYIYIPGEAEAIKLDSVAIASGKFVYRGILEGPTAAYISADKSPKQIDDPNIVTVFLEPTAMQIRLEMGNFKDVQLTGSKTQQEQDELDSLKKGIQKRLKPFSEEYNRRNLAYIDALKAGKPESELELLKSAAHQAKEKLSPFYDELRKIDDDFIQSHPDSYLTASLLQYRITSLPIDSAKAVYARLTPRIQHSRLGQDIRKSIEKMIQGSPGSMAPLFSATDIDGKLLRLEDYRGKYVLLDFWASWCVPCRAGNPHLLELYAKYKEKGFEIIGISDDDSKPEAWRKAVAQDNIGVWKHVLRGLKRTESGFDHSQDISEPYDIHSLPTKILIDPQGMIIGRYGGGGEDDAAMDKKLKEIFM